MARPWHRAEALASTALAGLARALGEAPSLIAVASALLVGLAADLVLASGLRWLGLAAPRLDGLVLALAALTGLAAAAAYRRRAAPRVVLAAAAFVALAGIVCVALDDTSWDSESYHYPAVVALAHGWNPLLQPSSGMTKLDIWPNGIWTVAAQLFNVFGLPELGKVLNAMLAVAALAMSAAAVRCYRPGPPTGWEALLVLLLLANPVLLSQLFTFMLDGDVYALSLSIFAATLLTATEHRRTALLVLAASLIVLIDTKLAGIYFAASAGLCGWLLAPQTMRARLEVALVALAAVSVAVGFVGWRPYLTNLARYGTPIALGPWSLDRPSNLAGALPPLQLALSWIGETNGQGMLWYPKLPLTVRLSEIRAMATPDPRIAGFGPLFAPALAVALVGTLMCRRAILAEPASRRWLFAAAGFLAICAVFPEAWLARYAPLGWAVPVFLLLSWPAEDQRRWLRLVGVVALLLALANSGMALVGNLGRLVVRDRQWQQMVAELRGAGAPLGLVPAADTQFHVTFAERLGRAGLVTTLVRLEDCGHRLKLYRGLVVCALAPAN